MTQATKPKQRPPSDIKTRGSTSTTANHKGEARRRELQQLWGEQIKLLRDRRFTTVAEAVDALVESVGARLGQGGDEEKTFLRDLLLTDPTAIDTLRKSLKITEPSPS